MTIVLDVLSTGAVTPAGLSAPQTCAALRARIVAFRERQFLPPPAEPIVGAVIPAREHVKSSPIDWLLNLAARAALECLGQSPKPVVRLAVMLSVPEPHRLHPAFERCEAAAFARRFAQRVGVTWGESSVVVREGHAGMFRCLELARLALAESRADACLVGGVDSLLNRTDVERLAGAERLYGTSAPQGVIPGEGAAFMLVGARQEQAGSGARFSVLGLGFGNEQDHLLGERYATGTGLQAALMAAVADANCEEKSLSLRISDMDGERHRAWDSMIAFTRFYRTRRETLPVWYPAASIGNTGAAAAGVAVIAAGTSLARGYAPGHLVMCEASSENGLRGACVVGCAGGAPLPPFRTKALDERSWRLQAQ